MAFYIRYYEDETLLQKAEEIIPYLQGINKLTPEELDIISKRINKLRSGTNRIYLDAAKKRYLLAIGTAQTSIEAFQKNHRTAQPAPATPHTPTAETTEPKATDSTSPWKFYYLAFSMIKDETTLPYQFKAKIKDATLESAYQQMADYLRNKHNENCIIPDFSEDVIWSEEIVEEDTSLHPSSSDLH